MSTPRLCDEAFLARAIKLAARGLGHTRPNPAVGAVIVKRGIIIGEGWHKKAGGDHAEVAAIKDAKSKGIKSFKGSVIYVTLEPCSKPGRVGACTEAIAAAGIAKVVYAVEDPNPVNRGKAAKALAKYGIECVQFERPSRIYDKAKKLIRGFEMLITHARPFITVKIAMSLDGKICDFAGDAKWVSSQVARTKTGKLREGVDAIMVGGHTVRMDNPTLLSHGKVNNDLLRVVISRSGKLPKKSTIFTDGKNETVVFSSIEEAMANLAQRGITWVLCEGGLDLARSLAAKGLVDEWIAVLAPKVIGNGRISEATEIKEVVCLQDW